MNTAQSRYGALVGIAAAAVAIGSAELVAAATGPRSAPLVAVGGVVVDLVPEPLKQFAIDVFGVHDKIALLVGTGVLLAGCAALIGIRALRVPVVGYLGIALFGLLGTVAALTRPGAGVAAALPSLLGAALGAGAFRWLRVILVPRPWPDAPLAQTPAAPGTPPEPPVERKEGPPVQPNAITRGPSLPEPGGEERRRFLTGVAVTFGAAAVGGFGGRWLGTRRGVSDARAAVTLPTPASPAAPVPAGADLDLTQLAPYTTPNRQFYRIDTALVVPQVDPGKWKLRIHGRVRNPITLTYADLLARPLIERDITLACVSNEVGGDLIGNARWLGVPLADLLEQAGPLDDADQVVGRSADGWTCGTPTSVLRDGRDAMLAIGMNGEPLPVEHGFPARVVVPGLYGYVSACKWVVELELTRFADFDAYWVPRGWAPEGPIKTQSRIDTPRPRNRPAAGPVTVAGVAWAQHRGIKQVEVQVDGEPWQPATLAPTASIDTWVQWSWRWEATPGEHTLRVRATDATGATQPGEPRPVAPDGATGWHSVRVTVR
ncbi:DMSO/TMAO reductase YedYZ molybdopterin-dependent catalytic subunit [Micromonospora pisi]|uniref:DMSO/TMAO reductase YedYZ molybdopterin-dependent catalytic subunit n=1 Tax=Micromonospora pisi TaxID=589240 RepID=A0A495JNE8_9ACTN|nr:sulfite oxidase [Micromonospora pisi]RKR90165.1 DMSO/TMAO reductase YedYZ molybdopterin-dependent catalytic subunit [Micromonospora pisi]